MTAPVEVRDQARALREQGKTYREIGERLGVHQSTALRWAPNNLSAPDRLGPNRSAQDASGLVPDARCRRDHKRERAAAAERKARKARALAELADPPSPPQSFARVYAAALAEGIDLLEERDACWECKDCGRLPVEGCVCVPVREEKAA